MKNLTFALAAATIVSSCASMKDGTTQSVAITSVPAGATCQYDNGSSSGTVITPGDMEVQRSAKSIMVQCQKQGYGVGSAKVQPWPNYWTGANVLNLGVGYFYDISNGAAWRYPQPVNVVMQPNSATYHGDFMMAPGSSAAVPPIQAATPAVEMQQIPGQSSDAYEQYRLYQQQQQNIGQPQYGTPNQTVTGYSQPTGYGQQQPAAAYGQPVVTYSQQPVYGQQQKSGSANLQDPSVTPPGLQPSPYEQMVPPGMR